MDRRRIDSFIDLLHEEGDLSPEEIFGINPELRKESEHLLSRVNAFLLDKKEERELPWLSKANKKINRFHSIQEVLKENWNEFREMAAKVKSGERGTDLFPQAQQFFREKGVEDFSEEELAKLIHDLEALKKMKDEDQ